MYAIVEIAGKQFSVREKDQLVVPRLQGNAKDSVTLDRVLLVAGNGDVHIGTPVVPDASVEATILEHVKGDKILVFRKKRRKRFKVKRGHRQPWTRIEINALSVGDKKADKKKSATKGKKQAVAAGKAEGQADASAVPKAPPAAEAPQPESEAAS